MKRIKRLSAFIIALALAVSMTSYASATDINPVSSTSANDGGVYITIENNLVYFDTFDNVWKAIVTDEEFTYDGDTYNEENIQEWYGDETSFEDILTNGYYFVLKTAQTVTSSLTVEKDIQIQAAHSAAYAAGPGEAVTHTFSGSIAIKDGGSLSFVSGYGTSSYPSQVTVIFSNPIVVESNGELNLRSANPSISNTGSNASTEDIFKLAESATGPLIQVQKGGSAVLVGVALETNGSQPAVEVNGELTLKEVVTHDLSITSTGSAPAISVGEGGTLKLEAPESTEYTVSSSSDGVPAIAVASGGTVEIPNSSNIAITADSNNVQAIDLAASSTIKKGDIEVTVSEVNDEAGDNYVDNYGNVILAANPSEDDEDTVTASKIILADGTIIEGSEKEPLQITYEGNEETSETVTQVTVPAGGSVQQPDENDATVLPGGGTVDGGSNNITVNVADVSLSSQTLSISKGDTATLSATVSPEEASNKTVTWTSSDETVATVDENGTVTAVGYGKATITATVDGKTATCTVIVPAPYIPPVNSNPSYTISTPSSVDNGTVTVSPSAAKKGATVTITATPDEGYEIAKVTVTDAKGNQLALTDKGNGKYTFVMPASKVDIDVTFQPVAVPAPPVHSFTDVAEDAWYADAVQYVFENGLMAGISDTTFAPNATTTRGMIATILYRLEREPAVSGSSPFTDVEAGLWYTDAIAWASANGVVKGYSPTTFGPNDPITREQMAAMLYRYAAYKGYDVAGKADLSGYVDADQVSSYATEAMEWANLAGLINGTSDTTLSPTASAIRAQVAAILMRFCENVVK